MSNIVISYNITNNLPFNAGKAAHKAGTTGVLISGKS